MVTVGVAQMPSREIKTKRNKRTASISAPEEQRQCTRVRLDDPHLKGSCTDFPTMAVE
jgi:hypothetical protein